MFRMDPFPPDSPAGPARSQDRGNETGRADRATEIDAEPGLSRNLLVNPGFETINPPQPGQAFAWQRYGDGFDEVPVSEGWFLGYRAPEGKRALGVAAE